MTQMHCLRYKKFSGNKDLNDLHTSIGKTILSA